MSKQDFLFELLTEDLPAKTLSALAQSLMNGVADLLQRAGFSFELDKTKDLIASPRRLGFIIRNLTETQPTQKIERKGPAINAAYDAEGKPTKAALGFATSCGVDFSQITTQKTDKGEWLYFVGEQPGKTVFELLPEIIQQAIKMLPIPKPMSWGEGEFSFLRPVHGVLALFGDKVIPMNLLGMQSGNQTVGHRFHHPEAISVSHPSQYKNLMHQAKVMPFFEERQNLIARQIEEIEAEKNARAEKPKDLLNEVTGLVEWPVALMGKFEERFLQVPKEVLILSMQTNQKYFALKDQAENLLPYFITICNIESKDANTVVHGNERVIRARFSDAEFFFTTDQKKPLSERVEGLKSIIFQKSLGTLWDKTQRIKKLAGLLAAQCHVKQSLAEEAAELSKADLVTGMVGEFPELQGLMGRYYALLSGKNSEVAQALDEQYQPRFAGDQLPSSGTGLVLALADRLDTLIGIFGVGLLPTGDKDPFALRRAALGVLRIILERNIDLDLKDLLQKAYIGYEDKLNNPECLQQVLDFCLERLRNLLLEQGCSAEITQSVYQLPRQVSRPIDIVARVGAVQKFMQLPQAAQLVAANKRVGNILSKVELLNGLEVKQALLQEQAEKELFIQLELKQKEIEALDYEQTLLALASLQQPIDQFFDHVMVMAEDQVLRNNRLALLDNLRGLFLRVADISYL